MLHSLDIELTRFKIYAYHDVCVTNFSIEKFTSRKNEVIEKNSDFNLSIEIFNFGYFDTDNLYRLSMREIFGNRIQENT